MIRLESGGDGHFLGVSSGLHLARSVLESARRNSTAFDNHEPAAHARRPPATAQQDTIIEQESEDTEIQLPSWETATGLIDIFFKQYHIQYPILVQDQFGEDVRGLYSRSENRHTADDPSTTFMLNMVLSISLHLLSQEDPDSARLAEGFRRSATAQLSNVMRSKNHRTLQCLLLLLLLSILNSRSAPMWYISGICMRMCVDLGYHSERTITYSGKTVQSEEVMDTKRRLFWVTYTFDRGLAKMLGRPFFIDDDKIDVQFPCSSLKVSEQRPVLHWLRMQRLQSELVRRLQFSKTLSSRLTENDLDMSSWKIDMSNRLVVWLEEAKQFADRDGHSMDWWEYWYHNARLMLHQPVSHATAGSLLTAYEAAKTMVHLSFIRAHRGMSGFTWLDLHFHLVSGLTLLFLALKSRDVRSKARGEWAPFKSCTVEWQVVLDKLGVRWDSMMKTKEVLSRLADETMEGIEDDARRNSSRSRPKRITRKTNYSSLIIQELSSPSLSRGSSLAQSTTSPGSGNIGRRRMTTARSTRRINQDIVMSSAAIDTSPSEEYTICQAQSQDQQLQQPQQTTNFPDDPYHRNEEFGSAALFDSLDFPSILGGDFWAGLDQFESPLQLHLSNFELSGDPSNAPGMETFGLPWMVSAGGRLDATLTDSVLNFQGNFDEGRGGL